MKASKQLHRNKSLLMTVWHFRYIFCHSTLTDIISRQASYLKNRIRVCDIVADVYKQVLSIVLKQNIRAVFTISCNAHFTTLHSVKNIWVQSRSPKNLTECRKPLPFLKWWIHITTFQTTLLTACDIISLDGNNNNISNSHDNDNILPNT